jgi:transcriptional regulator with XRE-family HTH domain
MGTPGIPNYYGRQLLRQIRLLRERAGLTQDEAGRSLHLTLQKLSRIENGQLPGYHELRAMLKLYGLSQLEWSPYLQLWERARQRGWWRRYGLRDCTYICMEQEASTMFEFQLGRLPELLQTEQYACRSLTEGDEKSIANTVALRIRRQERLTEDVPLMLHALVHEPTLRQGVDRAQLLQLVQRAHMPNVTIQIVTQSLGLHAGLDGSVTLLEFDDPHEPQIAFADTILGLNHPQDDDRTSAVRTTLEHLAKQALSPADSLDMLNRLAT